MPGDVLSIEGTDSANESACFTTRRTQESYVRRARAFIKFHGLRHPAEMGSPEVEALLCSAPACSCPRACN